MTIDVSKLCVGAASYNTIVVAASLGVRQIVASRGQVDDNGYVCTNRSYLVNLVASLSGGRTTVVRDHGGPLQGRVEDDGIDSFDQDVVSGFHALHIDVCKLPVDEQADALASYLTRYKHAGVGIEIGGERDSEDAMWELLLTAKVVGVTPSFVVGDIGGHVHADRQIGHLRPLQDVPRFVAAVHKHETLVKAHNMDWVPNLPDYAAALDAVNVAPEYGAVEVDAWLRVMSIADGDRLLDVGHASDRWKKWFSSDEGSWYDRARCGARYMLNHPAALVILEPYRTAANVAFVRRELKRALLVER